MEPKALHSEVETGQSVAVDNEAKNAHLTRSVLWKTDTR